LKAAVEKTESTNALLRDIKIIATNRWQPPPTFHVDNEDFPVEKVNQDIPVNTLKVTYSPGPTLLKKEKYIGKLKLLNSEGHLITDKEFEANKALSLGFPFDEASFKAIDHADLTIEIYAKKGFLMFSSNKVKMREEKLHLSSLSRNIDLEKQYKFGTNPVHVMSVLLNS